MLPSTRRLLTRAVAAAVPLAAAAATPLITGCTGVGSAARPGEPPPVAAGESDAPRPERGRAQLWAENCPRCHNARPPTFYTARQWQISMHHMRVRAALTADETRKVAEFFRAAKGADAGGDGQGVEP